MKLELVIYRIAVGYLAMAILLAVCFVPACFAVTVDEANAAVDQAEGDLGSAYFAVAEAEAAGADVSALLNTLAIAGNFLSKAHFSVRGGDYENANLFATECSSAVAGIADAAGLLEADAKTTHSNNLFFTLVESTVGLVLVIVCGLLGWRLLKKRYFKRVLDSRPAVEVFQ